MRRKKALRRGRIVSVIAAAGIGYALGSWNAAAVRTSQASGALTSGASTAAQAVALRFPSDLAQFDPAPAPQAGYQLASAETTIVRNDEGALFRPEPMIPSQAAQAEPPQDQTAAPPQMPIRTADISTELPALPVRAVAAPVLPKSHELAATTKPRPAPVRHPARPSYMFDDAQLASIKRRLNLTPDQESMWPAVAAALRNVGIEREREARTHGAPGEVNPDSPQVADLKSAAIPLLMSFSDEQKDEVRTIARGMGLSQLASQF